MEEKMPSYRDSPWYPARLAQAEQDVYLIEENLNVFRRLPPRLQKNCHWERDRGFFFTF